MRAGLYPATQSTKELPMKPFLILLFFLILLSPAILFFLLPEKVFTMVFNAMRKKAGLEKKEIELEDGTRYVFLDGGKGEPLILIHGFGGNKDQFLSVAPALTSRYRLILMDLPGFGESSKTKGIAYTPKDQARWLDAFTRKLGLASFHLGGNSMGGQISLSYAASHPEKVKSLWLLAPAGLWDAPLSAAGELSMQGKKAPLLVKNEKDFEELMAFVMEKPSRIPRAFMRIMARQRMDNYELEKGIARDMVSQNVREEIRGLQTPSLIVWGTKDRMLNPATAAELKNLLPASEVNILENIGHIPMLEAPGKIVQDFFLFQEKRKKTEE